MAKDKVQYQCSACENITPKWNGQCGNCGEWNTLNEQSITSNDNRKMQSSVGYSGSVESNTLGDVVFTETDYTATSIGELDRVLGGGIVAGSVILIGGDPGIGKSTILLQTLAHLASKHNCIYISGEESVQQIALRAKRLQIEAPDLALITETCVETILATANKIKPKIMVLDSIQTLFTESLSSAPGSVSQVRESAAQVVRYAKQTGTAIILVGHVTKEGALAGPRVLEHMVDTVLYFEGGNNSRYRVIRAVKNRFGAVNELGVFAMTETGLKAVSNPSSIFLSRHDKPVSGSTVMVTREGTRPMLIEVQALVDSSHGNPRRVTLGLEQNRLSMLLAVMHRHAGIAMFDQDVFVNIVGGLRISETAADLPVLMAALSSFRDKALDEDLALFGEVGLAGEIRPVPYGDERLIEASKHGFKRAIVPKLNKPRAEFAKQLGDMEVITIDRIDSLLDYC